MEENKKKVKNIPKPTNFGKNLKFLRRIAGLSQTQLAAEIEISRNKVASYETGIVEPNAITFLKFCDFFKIQPNAFLLEIFVENPTDVYSPIDEGESEITSFLQEQIDEFVVQTNEMTKILQGYTSFIEIQKDKDSYLNNRPLYSTIEDLLSLLRMHIDSNWKLIQAIIPNQAKDQ